MAIPAIAWWLYGAVAVGLVYAFSGGDDEKKPDGDDDTFGMLKEKKLSESDVDCSKWSSTIPGPQPGMGTGFDALPKTPLAELDGASWQEIMMSPLKITKDTVSFSSQETAALMAENLGSEAYCAGYTDAGYDLFAKADEIRSWVIKGIA